MPRSPFLGDFEHLVLLALLRLGPDAYGTTIRREIEAHTGRTVSVGALYTALSRDVLQRMWQGLEPKGGRT